MTRVSAVVVACVRCWTRMYTWRLPPALREARCEEIESDLWEASHDPQTTQAELIVQMVLRLTLGAIDDLAWRVAQGSVTSAATFRRVTAAAVTCTLMLAALFRLTADVPDLPEVPTVALHVPRAMPDPPPPSPALRAEGEPIFQYGRSAYAVVAEGPQPVLIKEVQPIYPPVAVAAGFEGHVLVQARITERGRVEDAHVAPPGILAQSAIHAVRQWEFAAAGNRMQRPALLTVRVSFGRAP